MNDAIGMLELTTIARGLLATDAMVKAAPVKVLASQTICAGKYMILVAGDVADVKAALQVGREAAGTVLIDELTLPNPHEGIFPALAGTVESADPEAVGVVETFTVAASVVAADMAAKSGDVVLKEIRIANGLGGKSFVVFLGDVASVQEGLRAATAGLEGQGLIVDACIITGPHPEFTEAALP